MSAAGRAAGGLRFAKLHGAGNDFLLFDGRDQSDLTSLLARRASALCDRRLGIGADGVLLVTPEDEGRARVDYWNADGSMAAFCANGTRCAARFVADRWGWCDVLLRTGYADIPAHVDRQSVRLTLPASGEPGPWLRLPVAGSTQAARFLVVGVPHLVIPVGWDDFWTRPLAPLAPALRCHPELPPGGANVNFVRVIAGELGVRSWERGVEGETLSCGSGDVAAALVALADAWLEAPVAVRTASGRALIITASPTDPSAEITLDGPAEWVCDGTIHEELASDS